MDFETRYNEAPVLLMEGSVGERLKREHNIKTDGPVGLSDLIYDETARNAMADIYTGYIRIAQQYNLPFIATTTTRRANKERVTQAEYSESIIADNVNFLKSIRQTTNIEMYVGGLMGCKGDAYMATEVLSGAESLLFHTWQATLFKNSGVDFLFAGIMPALEEAVGMAKAMEATGLPYIISFMIRDNGKLIDETTIHDAIETIDNLTLRNPLCYMVNCVHPRILISALNQPFNRTNTIRERFRGIQANTSWLPPEELDDSSILKTSDSSSLANEMFELYSYIKPKIFGGCCGTNNSHIEEIARRLKSNE